MKTVLLVIVALVVIGGGAFGAASFGLVQIPGISPINFGKPVHASSDEKRGLIASLSSPLQILADRAAADASAPKKVTHSQDPTDTPKVDQSLGDQKIAEIWNGLEAAKLAEITDKWPEKNLARILLKMDPNQVTEFLAGLPTPRATKISQAIQQLASLPPVPAQTS